MTNEVSFDYNSFVVANAGSGFNRVDYIHAIYSLKKVPADFAVCVSGLFWPEFKLINGMIFLSELFDREQYQKMLSQGGGMKEICFWMNLLEITGLFENLSYKQAKLIARNIESAWNAKLKIELDSPSFFAKYFFDENAGEVFVTIDADY